MQAIERAVVALTKPHVVMIGEHTAYSEPLLTLLKEARYPNLGKSKGGAGTGDQLDLKAVDMYEAIDGGVRAWLQHFRQHHTGDLLELTQRLFDILKAEHAGGRLDDPDRMFAMFQTWVHRIEDHFDPPHEYELTAACPECGETHAADGEGQLKRAVRVQVKTGRALLAECFACGKVTGGQEQLVELAEQMGDVVDWVALRELTTGRAEEITIV